MADITWSDISKESRDEIQAEAVAVTTTDNPKIPAGGPTNKRTALDSSLRGETTKAHGVITLAINEVLSSANASQSSTNAFGARFNKILGDEYATPEDWEALQAIGGNVTKAILNTNQVVQNMEFGTMTIAELEVTLNPVYVVRCNFWLDTEQTLPFEFGTFSLDGTTFAGQEQNFEITGVAPGPYIVQFGHVDGYVDPLRQEITIDSSTTIDCIYTRI